DAELTVEPKGSGEKSEVELDFTLGKVNEPQTIKAPAHSESIEGLFNELGINPLELLGMMEGGGGEDFGSLLESITGAITGNGSSSGKGSSGAAAEVLEEAGEALHSGAGKEFQECLSEAESAADVQKCASLME